MITISRTYIKTPTGKFKKILTKHSNNVTVSLTTAIYSTYYRRTPQAPTIKAQYKIHKPCDRIRPVINNMNDTAYKIFKHVVNEQNKYLNLDHQITTKNSINLEEFLTKLKLNSNYRMSIYDINDLYVNIPTKEILRFTKSLLVKQNDAQTTKQIITLLDVILQQNYFSFKNIIYQRETGISMVFPNL